jgi:nicotinate-nucleotide adenylyltransferase
MDDLLCRLSGSVNSIAIMGGTFDPIHYGHLVTAETVREKYGFERIIFIPSGKPPHKKSVRTTPGIHRYTMVQMATVSNKYFDVSSLEIDREGYTYTIDTIKELRQLLGSGLKISFITGADSIFEIMTWKDAEELLTMCNIIAVTRPGYDRKALAKRVVELKSLYNSDIITIDVPAFAISSTDIRKRVQMNMSIKYLLPENVENYILKNNLYNVME